MANNAPTPRTGRKDIAPMVRGAFINALEEIKRTEGKTFSEIIAEWIRTEGIGPVLMAVSKFTVKEREVSGKVEHDHKHTHVAVSESLGWIAGLVEVETGTSDRAFTKPVQN